MSFLQPQPKGSIAVGSSVGAAGSVTPLAVGADGTVLTADSTTPTGLKYASAAASAVSARDAIVEARVVSGNADFFSVSSLTLTLLGATKSFVYNIGGTEYTISSDATTLAVTDTAHNFIYIDDMGALGRSALPCIYSFATPGAPVAGQHWYDLGDRQMKEYNGATFVNVSRIFIGYVRADGGSIAARYVCEPIGLQPLDRWNLLGDGSDGFLDLAAGTTTIDGTRQYTAIVLRAAAVLNHSIPGATNAPLFALAQGVVAVLGTASFNLNGLGAQAAAALAVNNTAGPAGPAGGLGGAGGGGGAGANVAAVGGAGGNHTRTQLPTITGGGIGATNTVTAATAGEATSFAATPGMMIPFLWLYGAAGGGGGSGSIAPVGNGVGGSGGGGGIFKAAAIALASTASITANGVNGTTNPGSNNGGGGGGGGGGIVVVWARNINLDGTFTATGGTGAAGAPVLGIGSTGFAGGVGRAIQTRL